MRIFLTGIDGLLGSNLAWYFRDKANVMGTFGTHPVAMLGVETVGLDLQDYGAVRRCLRQFSPDVVIHGISDSSVGGGDVDSEGCWRSHVLTTRTILDASRDLRVRMVLVSTDAIAPVVDDPSFWGGGDRSEFTRIEAERMVAAHPGSLVLRAGVFGWGLTGYEGVAEGFLKHFLEKEKVIGFTDAVVSALYTFHFARLLDQALEQGVGGCFRAVPRNPLSHYSFGTQLAKIFGLDSALIEPGESGHGVRDGEDSQGSAGSLEQALGGYRMPGAGEGLEAFFQDWQRGVGRQIKDCLQVTDPVCILPQRDVIPYGCQFIDQSDLDAVFDVLNTWSLTQGPTIDQFEKAVAQVVAARYAVAVSSGTSALHMACLACGVGPGDEVVTSPITFAASANCAVYCGATPVFVDIDPRTANMDPEGLEQKITPETRAIIPVHFSGQSCHMERIREIAIKKGREFGHKISIIEDACHALGSFYRGDPVGSGRFSDMTVFSFHPVKHVTTGEGGMVVTNDSTLDQSLRLLRSHGISKDFDESIHGPWYYEQVILGYHYRITDLQCALGLSQMKKLPWFRKRRREIVQRYNEAFSRLSWGEIPYEEPQCDSNFHLYVLRIDFSALGQSRIEVMRRLKDQGIYTQVHYIPVFTHPFYRAKFPVDEAAFPHSRHFYNTCLSLPLFPGMSDKACDVVIRAVCALA
ncbi:MAG: UDP-4-amino-4,6-dideoxy-N-acetyl-beta-L-altrosamine transaminase [Nitrospirae bacterium]|nr:UDP-4-amino-4,6-dideoxy-N-acetyl-beta-L-altrosamine transaminase [Magnetococcales bacterium]HAT51364.1 UDP-4-amino-4,6-dideoxy-N-acetyl-beta-L-altrosamine transaminase [Alphaproteobacteria bacterium]